MMFFGIRRRKRNLETGHHLSSFHPVLAPDMGKFALQIKASMDNVQSLEPTGESFQWFIKVKCNNCQEESPAFVYLSQDEEVELPTGHGNANLIIKCKLCSRVNSVDIVPKSVRAYETSDAFSSVVDFEARGVDPVAFSPQAGWTVTCPSGTKFTDVDLTEQEWTEFDEKSAEPVSIMELQWQFVSLK
eukprot:m.89452 g.89452  ORF g.89452 m.89452 type:complete len:188 (+) comp18122_c0_seq1:1249-1812(+)